LGFGAMFVIAFVSSLSEAWTVKAQAVKVLSAT
jgi:hypothetical protein